MRLLRTLKQLGPRVGLRNPERMRDLREVGKQTRLTGLVDGVGVVGRTEFVPGALEVATNRVFRQTKNNRALPVGLPLGNPFQAFALAWRQRSARSAPASLKPQDCLVQVKRQQLEIAHVAKPQVVPVALTGFAGDRNESPVTVATMHWQGDAMAAEAEFACLAKKASHLFVLAIEVGPVDRKHATQANLDRGVDVDELLPPVVLDPLRRIGDGEIGLPIRMIGQSGPQIGDRLEVVDYKQLSQQGRYLRRIDKR